MKDFHRYPGIEIEQNESRIEVNLEKLKRDGYFLVKGVLSETDLAQIRSKMDAIWEGQLTQYGAEFLEKLGDFGQIRGMMKADSHFYDLIIHPIVEQYLAATVGSTSILHLQNGIVLFPDRLHNQARYHRDFPKDFIPSKILSFNAFWVIDPFTAETGGTWVVPGSHRFEAMPSEAYIKEKQVQIHAPAGSILFFDSMLWHKGGQNFSDKPRRAINQQYTRAFIKQQLDYPSFLKGEVEIESKLAQRLGMWALPPKSVDEYRVDHPSKRTYRAGQG